MVFSKLTGVWYMIYAVLWWMYYFTIFAFFFFVIDEMDWNRNEYKTEAYGFGRNGIAKENQKKNSIRQWIFVEMDTNVISSSQMKKANTITCYLNKFGVYTQNFYDQMKWNAIVYGLWKTWNTEEHLNVSKATKKEFNIQIHLNGSINLQDYD